MAAFSNQIGVSSFFRPISFLVFVASTTLEKIEHSNIAAAMQNAPVLFRDIREIAGPFLSVQEIYANRLKHAEDKSRAIEPIVLAARDPSSEIRANIEGVCRQLGVPFYEDNIIFMTDDTGAKMALPVWSIFRKLAESSVGADLLQCAEGWKPGEPIPPELHAGPGPELGPITGALTPRRHMALAATAAAQAKGEEENKDHLRAYREESTCILMRLGDSPGAPVTKLDASTELLFVDQAAKKQSEKFFDHPYQFLAHTRTPDTPIADRMNAFLGSESQRASIVSQIVRYAHHPESGRSVIINFGSTKAQVTKRKNFKIVNPLEERIKLPRFWVVHKAPRDHFHVRHIMEGADAIFLPTYDATTLSVRLRNCDTASSLLLDKKLNPPDIGKPMVILDDGCWSPLINPYREMINNGMSKDSERPSLIDETGVQHIATTYFDLIRSNDEGLRLEAAAHVLDYRRKHSHPSTLSPAPMEWSFGGRLPDRMPPTVAVYTSAINENLTLKNDLVFLADLLTKAGVALVWGGMDQHAGGALYEAYEGPLNIAISTPYLIASETRTGHMPECDYWEIQPTLTKRRQRLMELADAAIVFPGGEGTLHELIGELRAKSDPRNPLSKRPLAVYSPDLYTTTGHPGGPYYRNTMRGLMGESFYDNIHANPNAYADRNIYMPTNRDDLALLLHEVILPQLQATSYRPREAAFKGQQFARRL